MIVVADPSSDFQDLVFKQLDDTNNVVRAERLGELERLLRDHVDIEAVLVGPNIPTEDVLEAAPRLHRAGRGAGVVLVSESVSSDLLRSALRSGFQDVIEFPFTRAQLNDAVEIARAHYRDERHPASETEGRAGNHVLTVFSTKGGCGKSFIASNLAILLAEISGDKVGLVDLDLQSGDLAIMFQLLPAWSISDAVENLERLDSEALSGYLTEHKSGVQLLAAPAEPSMADAVTSGAVQRVLEIMRGEFRYTVVDGPALFTEPVLGALDESDECLLVTSMDVPSIKNLKLALQTLDRLGINRESIRLVLNRADSNVGLRLSEVEKALGTKVDIAIPSSRDVPLSVNQGVPLAAQEGKRSAIISPLEELAASIVGVDANAKSKRSGPFWRRG